jgi:hypothetical protein
VHDLSSRLSSGRARTIGKVVHLVHRLGEEIVRPGLPTATVAGNSARRTSGAGSACRLGAPATALPQCAPRRYLTRCRRLNLSAILSVTGSNGTFANVSVRPEAAMGNKGRPTVLEGLPNVGFSREHPGYSGCRSTAKTRRGDRERRDVALRTQMVRRNALHASRRGCPASCASDVLHQRELSDEELRQLSANATRTADDSGWPCYICNSCGVVYVREAYLDIKLGRLPGWLK